MSQSTTSSSKLFQPIVIGDLTLKHRVVLAPLTRFRADQDHVPVPIVKEYYTQRASEPGTLLITEATYPHPRGGGYLNTPGIWSDEQIAAWKEIVDAVHAKGCYIYMQLWCLGSTADYDVLQKKNLPYVSSSALKPPGKPEQDPAPRPMTREEIKDFARYFAEGASNAVHKAGFDGVELHGAHGYLIEQFLKESSNRRTDEYGGSIENRSRFALEVLDAVVKAVGPRRTALRLSPWATVQGSAENDPRPLYTFLVGEIKKAHPELAYIHLVEPRVNGVFDVKDIGDKDNNFIREIWTQGPANEHGRRLISAGNYTLETATEQADKTGELIAFGRRFIANPDLPYRLRERIPLTPYDRKTFYHFPGTSRPEGLTDYPFVTTPTTTRL